MTKPLTALIVEDSEDDAQLLLRELRRGDYAVRFERVENAEQMSSALRIGNFDIVLSDYSLPQFDALHALELLKRSGIDIPFIIISGTMSEDVAVSAMKAGAHDYFSKGNLKRLLPAVERELREVQQRAARRQADDALKAQTRKLAEQGHLLDQAHVMARDLTGKITLWTRGMQTLYGWTTSEAVGQLSHSLLQTQFPRPLPEIEAEVSRHGAWEGELIHTTRSGEQIVVASHWALHRDLDGRPLAILEVDNDITERRRMEEALRNSETQYRIMFDGNPHPMWVYDLETLRFLTVNDAAVHQYGYSRSEFLGMTIKDIRPAEDVPALLESAAGASPDFTDAGVWQHRKKDDSLIKVEITSHGIDFEGRPAHLVLALDVTEKRRAQRALQEKADELAAMTQQLWQASKLATMGELAASVAHELNNPLATISLRVETLLEQFSQDEARQRSLQIVINEVERMANLVTNLLQFTRRSHRQISTVDVREEITSSVEFINYYLRNRKINVTKQFEDSLPAVHADRQQLRQLFLNLLTNATDAMPDGGRLTVRVRRETESSIVIEFSDSGEGIAPTDLEKIWQPFYTSKPEGKGTGLGLAICRRIVEEHDGVIRLDSVLGQGTTVRINLPAASHQAPASKSRGSSAIGAVADKAGEEKGRPRALRAGR